MGNDETKARILNCAKQEFMDKGYEEASMRKIAAMAGLTTGAIYGYFEDKLDMFSSLVEEAVSSLYSLFEEAHESFFSQEIEDQAENMNHPGFMEAGIDLIYRYFGRLERKSLPVIFGALAVIFVKNLIEFFYGLLVFKLYNPGDLAYGIIVSHMNKPEAVLAFLLGAGIILSLFALFRIKMPVPRESENPALRRMAKSFAVKKRSANRWVLFSMVLVLASGSVGYAYVNTEHEIRPSTEITLTSDGAFTVMKEDLEDGHIHRFNWKTPNGVNLVFWFIKKRENNYGAVFDGCEICGPAGYLEKGEDVICIECNVMMNRNTIGLKGGCNPIPIKNVLDNPDSLTVRAEDLLFQEPFFQGRGVQE